MNKYVKLLAIAFLASSNLALTGDKTPRPPATPPQPPIIQTPRPLMQTPRPIVARDLVAAPIPRPPVATTPRPPAMPTTPPPVARDLGAAPAPRPITIQTSEVEGAAFMVANFYIAGAIHKQTTIIPDSSSPTDGSSPITGRIKLERGLKFKTNVPKPKFYINGEVVSEVFEGDKLKDPQDRSRLTGCLKACYVSALCNQLLRELPEAKPHLHKQDIDDLKKVRDVLSATIL